MTDEALATDEAPVTSEAPATDAATDAPYTEDAPKSADDAIDGGMASDVDDAADDADEATDDADEATDDDAVSDDPAFALFEGDEGRLSLDQRRTLVALLKHRYISPSQHPLEWRTMLAAEAVFRSRLNELFLELQIDRNAEVAFKRQASSESGRRPFPTLLHDTAYTREETILLVYLRTRLRNERAGGTENVVVDQQELLDYVAGFRPAHATDRSRDEGRVERAIEKLLSVRVLLKTKDLKRHRIAPVVETLLPLERLEELLEWLQTQSDDAPAGDEHETTPATAPAGEETA